MQEQLLGSSAGTLTDFDKHEESKTTSREAIHAVQYSHVMVSRDAVDFSLELIDAAQENLNTAFDFARQLPEVNSPSILFEVSAGQVRKQFDNLTRQTQQLTDLAQKVLTDTAQCWLTAIGSTN
jgi:hypothetical protein